MWKVMKKKNESRSTTRAVDPISAAMDSMKVGAWEKAARQFRIASSRGDLNDAEIQYGHALKEAGFLSMAESHYLAGQHDSEKSVDHLIQLGHLSKVRGEFKKAFDFYARALSLAKEMANEGVATEVGEYMAPLRRLIAANSETDDGIDFYISSAASTLLKSIKNPAGASLGKANYSYAFAANGFVSALEDGGYVISTVENPEFFPAPRANHSKKMVHINFAPPPLARVMKGAYNILHFAWEFSRIPSDAETVSPHPFENWGRQLAAFDEIWLPSNYAVSVISGIVNKPVCWVPSPISAPKKKVSRTKPGGRSAHLRKLRDISWVPLSIFPRLQGNFANHAINRARLTSEVIQSASEKSIPPIFLTILNPHDKRKQLKPLLGAFCEFSKTYKDAVLLIKTSSPDDTNKTINDRILNYQIADDADLVRPYVSQNVWIFNGALSSEQLESLYDLASFFVCTSRAEGQNLPLLEAMAHGCVPVSVDHTAMADYIDEENSVVIPSYLSQPPAAMRCAYQMFDDFETYTVNESAVHDALERAVSLSDTDFMKKSNNSILRVSQDYSGSILCKKMEDRGYFPEEGE